MLAECTVCAYREAALVPHVGWLAGAISASADSGSMHGLCLYGGSLGPPCWLAGWCHFGIC